MCAQLPTAESNRYMKGKSRHLFWPYMAFLILMVIAGYVQNMLIGFIMESLGGGGFAAGYGSLAIGIVAVNLCGAAFFLLAYAFRNNVKTYKTLFIVLAITALPNAIAGVIAALRMIDSLTMAFNSTYATGWLMNVASGALGIAVAVTWVVCMIIFACSRHSSVAVRISAVLLALYQLYATGYGFAYPYLIRGLMQGGNYEAFSIINLVMGIANSLFYLAVFIFFFASMSFGRKRLPKILPAAAPSAQG